MTHRLPDPRFPLPDCTIKPEKTGEESEHFLEIDIGSGNWVMLDGRPALFENWLDCDTQTFCRTIYYSTLEAEEWSHQQHYEFVEKSGLIEDKTCSIDTAGLTEIEDKAGRLWWSVTIGIQDDED